MTNLTATDRLRWRRHAAVFALAAFMLAPVIALAIAHRVWIRRKALTGLRAKLGGHAPTLAPGAVVIHGVSLGEVALMRPLVPKLTAAGHRVLLTTTSETGRAALDRHFAEHDRAWLPLDLPWAVDRFLTTVRPKAVLLLELEVWPLLLLGCRQRGIPVAVVNGRLGDSSFRGYRRAGGLLRPAFAAISLALAQNCTWGARLAALGCQRTAVTGSMKSDMVLPVTPAQRDAEAKRLGLPTGGPCATQRLLVIASTSGEEERAFITDWASWGPAAGWRLALCPRHPERGGQLVSWCQQAGLATCQTSLRPEHPNPSADDVLVIDEIGRLPALYANASLTVVGGSLGSGRGGQNMLEPAAAGCCTVVGPDTKHFPDAMAALRATDGIVETTIDGAAACVRGLAADTQRREHIARGGVAAWRVGLGATDRVVAALTPILTPEPACP